LNSLKHFSVPAFAPCLLNISIIVFALLLGEGIAGLASGILVGGFLQLAVQVPVLYKKGFRLNLFKRFKHPAAKSIFKLMLPRILNTCIYQLNNFVDTIFGSLAMIVGEGGVAALYFAYRLILFPLGIFSTSLAQVILPTFSTQALEDNHDNLKRTLSFGLRATFFVLLPSSVGFMVLSGPIISTIFQGGRFDAYSTLLTSKVLFYFSIGLFAYGATRILQSCFFALKDTVTPTKVSAIALGMNIILNAAFMYPLKLAGIALATTVSGICSFLLLFLLLKKKIGDFHIKEIAVSFLRISAASIAMGATCFFISRCSFFLTGGAFFKYLDLISAVFIGVISYIAFSLILRVKEMHEVRKWLFARKR